MRQAFASLLILAPWITVAQSDTLFIRFDRDRSDDTMAYAMDTILFYTPQPHLVHGTMVLPWTEGQQWAKNFGLQLDSVSLIPCHTDREPEGRSSVAGITETNERLKIDLNLIANCCNSFLCDADIVSDSVINLLAYGYGMHCDCRCCFRLSYCFTKWTWMDDYDKIRGVIINNDWESLDPLR